MEHDDSRQRGLNFRQKIVVILMDLLFLIELTYSIYLGQQDPEYVTAIFLRTFIPLALATLITARILLRKMRTPETLCDGLAEAAQSRGRL